METRRAAEQRAQRFVNMTNIQSHLRWDIVNFVSQNNLEQLESKSAVIRAFLSAPGLSWLWNCTQDELAFFFQCSSSLVQKVLSRTKDGVAERPRGRPSLLTEENEAALTRWVEERTTQMDWITFRDFKRFVVNLLEEQGVTDYPSTQYYRDLVTRLDGGRYRRVTASPLEEERFNLSKEDVELHFRRLHDLELETFVPDLIINIDETGFGASQSHRMKSMQVIVDSTTAVRPSVRMEASRIYITAIAAITAGGSALPPGLIVRRSTMTEDFETIPLGSDLKVYSTERAFVTRNVFENYVRDVVLNYVQAWRQKHDQPDAKAMIIVDGHSAHFSPMLKAFCVLNGCDIFCMPPHSSHLLQALDRLYFSRVKQCYASTQITSAMSELSRQLLRVFTAFQASNLTYFICHSWAMSGIIPIVEHRNVVAVRLDPEAVLSAATMQHNFSGNPRERGVRNDRARWGLLTEDEALIMEANQCPFCCGELPPDWEWS